MNIQRKKILSILKIIYCSTIFINYLLIESFFNTNLLGRTRYIIASINIVLAILMFFLGKNYRVKKNAVYYFMLSVFPYVLIFLIMIIKSIMNSEIELLNQIIVFIYWFIPICQGMSAIYLFGKEAIDYTFFPTVANYALCVIVYLFLYKINGIVNFFYYVDIEVTPLEVHELTFTIGLFFLYYYLFEDKKEKNHRLKIALSIICLLVGFKRIEILALIVAIILYHIINSLKNERNQKIVMNIIFACCVIISIIYVIITRNGTLESISRKYNIDFKSRLEAYKYFNNEYEISMAYKGKGLGYVMDKLSEADKSLHGIGDLHNDILKLYIELGAVIWLAYFINFLLIQTNKIQKHYGKDVGKLYFVFVIFTYILYLTDNVNRYLNYILAYTIIPYSYFLQLKDKNSQEKEGMQDAKRKNRNA